MYVSIQTADVVDRVITLFTNEHFITTKGEILDSNLNLVLDHNFSNEEIALGVLDNFIPKSSKKEHFCWLDGNQSNNDHRNLMWTKLPTSGPIYEKVFGPYVRKDGRKHCVITYHEKQSGRIINKRTVSWPKLLMEQHLGVVLYPPLSVDHYDCDFTNDDFSNLRIMVLSDHVKQDAKRRRPVMGFCVECGVGFELTREQISVGTRKRIKSGPFCSKSCCGKFIREVQLKRRPPRLEPFYKNVSYYKNKQ